MWMFGAKNCLNGLIFGEAGLFATGVAPIPCGVWNTPNVPVLTAAPISNSMLLDANTAMATANAGSPTAIVMNLANQRVLQGLVDTLG